MLFVSLFNNVLATIITNGADKAVIGNYISVFRC